MECCAGMTVQGENLTKDSQISLNSAYLFIASRIRSFLVSSYRPAIAVRSVRDKSVNTATCNECSGTNMTQSALIGIPTDWNVAGIRAGMLARMPLFDCRASACSPPVHALCHTSIHEQRANNGIAAMSSSRHPAFRAVDGTQRTRTTEATTINDSAEHSA